MDIYFIGPKPLISYSNDIKYSDIDDAYDYLKNSKELSIDIETTRKFGGKYEKEGLDPYLSKIVMFQIGDKHRQYIIDYRTEKLGPLLELIEDPNIVKVGHNLKFEYVHILHNTGKRVTCFYDTMIAEQISYNGLNPQGSLKALVSKYLHQTVNKDTRLEFLTIGTDFFTETQIIYGAQDILNPLLIKEKQKKRIDDWRLNNCIRLEMNFIPVLGDIEYKGMYFDAEQWLALYNKNKIKYRSLEQELNDFVIDNYSTSKFIKQQLELFDTSKKCNIQWTSSTQVIKFLQFLGYCPEAVSKTTKKMTPTVNAVVLKSYLVANSIPNQIERFIRTYLKFKEFEQACTTFGKDFLKYINPVTKRIHSNYRQILNTGRISSSNPNLQNIPSDEEYRKCFTAPLGYRIVNADYSGQETVILANKSLEPNILDLLQSGKDMHCFVTRYAYPETKLLTDRVIKEYYGNLRQNSKAAGFAIQYGGNGHTISKNLGIPEHAGNEVYDAYFKAFPKLKDYFKITKEKAIKDNFITLDKVTGRKTWFPKGTPVGRIERASLNFPIQGEAGSITKLAAIMFRKWLLDNNLSLNQVAITNIIHDEINIEAIVGYQLASADALEEEMKKAGAIWCKKAKLNAVAKVSNYWGH